MNKRYLILVFVLIFIITSCSSNNSNAVTKTEETSKGITAITNKNKKNNIVSEDYKRAENKKLINTIYKTDKGYYYYAIGKGLRYHDIQTDKDIFLCNKPECKHDGNPFCVATNSKYEKSGIALYSGRLYVSAVVETETQYLYKLLDISLDGSELNEFVTYMTVEKAGAIPSFPLYEGALYIHRNKAFLPMVLRDELGSEDKEYRGVAIVDMETKEVSYLDEESLSLDNQAVESISAYGDYFYFLRKVGWESKLHRYNINTREIEIMPLESQNINIYAIYDDDTIYFGTDYSIDFYVYHLSTGEIEKVEIAKEHKTKIDEQEITTDRPIFIDGVVTDGEFIYVKERKYDTYVEGVGRQGHTNIHILDKDIKELAVIDIQPVIDEQEFTTRNYLSSSLSYTDDTVILTIVEVTTAEIAILQADKEDFVNGKAEFKQIFKYMPFEE